MQTQTLSYKSIRLWLWLAVIFLCLAGGGIRVWQNQQRRAAYEAWGQNNSRIGQASQQALLRIWDLWDGRHSSRQGHQRPSRSELENLLNDGQPFRIIKEDGERQVTRWTDPVSGVIFELKFHHDEWIGLEGTGKAPLNRPRPAPSPLDRFTENIQRRFAGSFNLGWGTGAWLVSLVLCIFWKQQRRILAEIMLALTLMCGTAWLVSPHYSLTLKDVLSNDMLFWAVIMLAISGIAFYATHRGVSLPPPWPVCSNCGYNLTGNVSGICPECGVKIRHSHP